MRALEPSEIKDYIDEHFPSLDILTPTRKLSNKEPIKLYCKKHDYTFTKYFGKMKHRNQGCKKCGYENIGNSLRKPLSQVKKELKEVHNNQLPYKIISTEKEYKENYPTIKLECNYCGKTFYNTQTVLLKGVICGDCGHKIGAEKQRYTQQEAEANLKELGWELLSKYKSSSDVIRARCLKCGTISIKTYHKIQQGRGCKQCATNKLKGWNRQPKEYLESIKTPIEKIRAEVAKNNPDIELLSDNYYTPSEGGDSKMDCRCKLCGKKLRIHFKALMLGTGCADCKRKQHIERIRWSYKEAVEHLKEINPAIKILTKDFKNSHSGIDCECLHCGNIWETCLDRLFNKKAGCPNCCLVQSDPELEVAEIFSDFEVIQSSRKIIPPYEIDIYIPELKLAIEFNGDYWHSIHFKPKYYHITKTLLAKQKGINLIHIFDSEWQNNKEQVTEYLQNIIRDKEPVPELGLDEYDFCKYPQLTPLYNPRIRGEGRLAYYDCGTAIDTEATDGYTSILHKQHILMITELLRELNVEYTVENKRQIITDKIIIKYIPIADFGLYTRGSELNRLANKDTRYLFLYEPDMSITYKWLVLQDKIIHALGKTKNKIYARNCRVEFTDEPLELKDFVDENSLYSYRPSHLAFYLVDNSTDEIVMAYCLGKAYGKLRSKYDYEITRGVSKLGYSVIGGATKLWKYITKYANENDIKRIVYYAELNTQDGSSINLLDGMRVTSTAPGLWNYWVEQNKIKLREPQRHQEIKELVKQGKVISFYNAGTKTFVWDSQELK